MEDSGRDATELEILSRDDLERRVRQQTAQLENIIDTMADVLVQTDPEGEIQRANDAVRTILGYDPEAIVGKPIDVLFASPTENEEFSDLLTRGEFLERLLRDGQVTDVEVQFATAEGDALPMSLSASTMTQGGAVKGIVCVAKDITERKRVEERESFLHSLLRHDLGNQLQKIDGYLTLLAESDLDEEQRSLLERAQSEVDDASDLIENVRTLRRISHEEPVPIAVAEIIKETVDRYADHARRHGFALETDIDSDAQVLGGRLLGELFANLLENALVHSGGETVRITTETRSETVVISVEDDGQGVPVADRARLTEKRYKGPDSSGTGLGLHLVERMTDSYGGDLQIGDSELGGARVTVTLDRADDD